LARLGGLIVGVGYYGYYRTLQIDPTNEHLLGEFRRIFISLLGYYALQVKDLASAHGDEINAGYRATLFKEYFQPIIAVSIRNGEEFMFGEAYPDYGTGYTVVNIIAPNGVSLSTNTPWISQAWFDFSGSLKVAKLFKVTPLNVTLSNNSMATTQAISAAYPHIFGGISVQVTGLMFDIQSNYDLFNYVSQNNAYLRFLQQNRQLVRNQTDVFNMAKSWIDSGDITQLDWVMFGIRTYLIANETIGQLMEYTLTTGKCEFYDLIAASDADIPNYVGDNINTFLFGQNMSYYQPKYQECLARRANPGAILALPAAVPLSAGLDAEVAQQMDALKAQWAAAPSPAAQAIIYAQYQLYEATGKFDLEIQNISTLAPVERLATLNRLAVDIEAAKEAKLAEYNATADPAVREGIVKIAEKLIQQASRVDELKAVTAVAEPVAPTVTDPIAHYMNELAEIRSLPAGSRASALAKFSVDLEVENTKLLAEYNLATDPAEQTRIAGVASQLQTFKAEADALLTENAAANDLDSTTEGMLLIQNMPTPQQIEAHGNELLQQYNATTDEGVRKGLSAQFYREKAIGHYLPTLDWLVAHRMDRPAEYDQVRKYVLDAVTDELATKLARYTSPESDATEKEALAGDATYLQGLQGELESL
jgi:hypothetical protein